VCATAACTSSAFFAVDKPAPPISVNAIATDAIFSDPVYNTCSEVTTNGLAR